MLLVTHPIYLKEYKQLDRWKICWIAFVLNHQEIGAGLNYLCNCLSWINLFFNHLSQKKIIILQVIKKPWLALSAMKTSLWNQQTRYMWRVAFLQTTKKNYLAEAEAVDFAESQMAVTIINNFVEKMTNGLIKDFLQSINPATRFYLFNG